MSFQSEKLFQTQNYIVFSYFLGFFMKRLFFLKFLENSQPNLLNKLLFLISHAFLINILMITKINVSYSRKIGAPKIDLIYWRIVFIAAYESSHMNVNPPAKIVNIYKLDFSFYLSDTLNQE